MMAPTITNNLNEFGSEFVLKSNDNNNQNDKHYQLSENKKNVEVFVAKADDDDDGVSVEIAKKSIENDKVFEEEEVEAERFDKDNQVNDQNASIEQQQEQMPWQGPAAQGLYDPKNEHEACGVGFIVSIDGESSHKILRDAQTLSERMNHRGACACDNDTGDGAGVMASIPHQLYAKAL